MALYPKAIKKLIPPGPTDPVIRARVAILHIAVTEAESLYDYFRERSGGVESHFYIRRDGTVEQYRDTAFEADANWHANPFAISIETQGMGSGEWSKEQIAAIKELLLWINANHAVPLVVAPKWDGAGVGYHILFMSEWAGGPRACPGPDRIKQFNAVLVPWMKAHVSSPHNPPTPPPVTPKPPPPASPPPPVFKTRKPKAVGLTKRGAGGVLVAVYQRILRVQADGIFGPYTEKAVKTYQSKRGLASDGVVGPLTARAMLLDRGTLGLTDQGPSVGLLQFIAGVEVDNIFGQVTKTATVEMQRWAGVKPDGLVGPVTAGKIVR